MALFTLGKWLDKNERVRVFIYSIRRICILEIGQKILYMGLERMCLDLAKIIAENCVRDLSKVLEYLLTKMVEFIKGIGNRI